VAFVRGFNSKSLRVKTIILEILWSSFFYFPGPKEFQI